MQQRVNAKRGLYIYSSYLVICFYKQSTKLRMELIFLNQVLNILKMQFKFTFFVSNLLPFGNFERIYRKFRNFGRILFMRSHFFFKKKGIH